MTHQQFEDWLIKLKNIWETKKPEEIVNLCAEDFLWYESPFSEPYKTKEQLLRDWQGILDQENIAVSYQILNIENNIGIAQWHVVFTRLPSREAVELDGIFKVLLDEQGKCTEFRQWHNTK